MTMRQQWAIVLGVVLALGVALFTASRVLEDELFPVSIGSSAPDFKAMTLDSTPKMKSIANYHGRVVLLNVWATWCAPCRVEMPSLEALHRSMGPRGLALVAVSVDDAGQEEQIRAFARQYGLTFELLHDATGKIQHDYQTTGVPETFLIGPDGVIRKKVIGAADWNSPANRALIERLLADASSPRASAARS